MKRTDFLEEVLQLADELARCAIFDGRGQCNWIAREAPRIQAAATEQYPTARALSPDLSNGTAGLALFFARVANISGSPIHRVTSLGAMRHAFRHAKVAGSTNAGNIGFYQGSLGVAWAGLETATLLGERNLERSAWALLRSFYGMKNIMPSKSPDFFHGAAGAILALTELHTKWNFEEGLALAQGLGDHLVQEAVQKGKSCPWLPPSGNFGLAHGAAGIGLSFARLHALSGREVDLEFAKNALGCGTMLPQGVSPSDIALDLGNGQQAMNGWSHGVPGRGLAQALAHSAINDSSILKHARLSLESCRALLERQLKNPGIEFNLYQGVAGNAECIWLMEEQLRIPDAANRACSVGFYGLERFGFQSRMDWGQTVAWPTGIPAKSCPQFMFGTTGIAHFLLRLHKPDIPTLLVPGNVSWF